MITWRFGRSRLGYFKGIGLLLAHRINLRLANNIFRKCILDVGVLHKVLERLHVPRRKFGIHLLDFVDQNLEVGRDLDLHHLQGEVDKLIKPLEVLDYAFRRGVNLEFGLKLLLFGPRGTF